MKNILVADVMTRDPITIPADASLLDAAKKLVKKRTRSLLIVHKKKLVGYLSGTDVIWAMIKKSKEDLSKIKALDISPKKIATIKPFTPISETIKKMNKVKFDRLPVIQKGELVGIITVKDILNFNPEVYPELEEFAQIRGESEKLKRLKKAKDRKSMQEGICEECGNQDLLKKVNGMMICESCRSTI